MNDLPARLGLKEQTSESDQLLAIQPLRHGQIRQAWPQPLDAPSVCRPGKAYGR